MQRIFFLVSLPRAGNTLLGSILNQNKNIGCTANSVVFEILHQIFLIKKTDLFNNFPDHSSFNNVAHNIISNYYKDWKQEVIIDRSPATTPANLDYYNHSKYKFIFLKRDLVKIVKSFIHLYRQNGDQRSIEEIFTTDLINDNSYLMRCILAYTNGLKQINKNNYLVLEYEKLIANPQLEIDKIYKFLKLKTFNHRFKNLDKFSINKVFYNDEIYDSKLRNLHKIRTSLVCENQYDIELPKHIINFCRNLEKDM